MEYKVKRSKRARSLSLTVHPDGEVVVTAPQPLSLAAIEQFLVRHSEWIRKRVERTKGKTALRIRRSDIPRLKREAKILAEQRARHFADMYAATYNKITIRNQRSRWGSCSKAGNLNFNYRIAALPRYLADYIIIHEVCHLLQFDHSKRFWELVARTVPEHMAVKKELRDIVVRYM